MVKNRLFAFFYRLFMVAVITAGLAAGSGITGGPARLLSYTGQSNILCAVYAAIGGAAALYGCIKYGARGSASYLPRLAGGATVTISFTALIFWALLVPFAGEQSLWTFGNLTLHAFSALLMVGDYVLFCDVGRLKKRDALLFALIPTVYVLEIVALGFSGVVFYIKDGVSHHFPYIFMDFYEVGWLAVISILVIATAFVFASLALIHVSNKRIQLHNNKINFDGKNVIHAEGENTKSVDFQ